MTMSRRRLTKTLIAAGLAAAVLVVGGTWLYVNVVEGDAPARLSLSSDPSTPPPATSVTGTTGAAATGANGTWTVSSGSTVGYRVQEVLFGQDATAVGRTNEVTGSLTIAGAKVTATRFVVQMGSVASDQSRRDGQFRNRIMSVDQYPTATFTLTSPIDLGGVPADGATVTAKATGDLTLRGVTKRVTFAVKARRTGGTVEVNGSIPITFADWNIPSPSFGPAEVKDHGDLEFLLTFAK
jgi:polyisoprenoid-binding protein YceI